MDEEIQALTPASRPEGITANKPSASPLARESKQSFKLPEKRWLTSGQRSCIIAYPATPVIVYILLDKMNHHYVRLLKDDPIGLQMTVGSTVLLIIGMVLTAFLFHTINQSLPAHDPATMGKRRVLTLAIGFGGFAIFVLPALLTVLYGPAVISIIHTLYGKTL